MKHVPTEKTLTKSATSNYILFNCFLTLLSGIDLNGGLFEEHIVYPFLYKLHILWLDHQKSIYLVFTPACIAFTELLSVP